MQDQVVCKFCRLPLAVHDFSRCPQSDKLANSPRVVDTDTGLRVPKGRFTPDHSWKVALSSLDG